MGGKGLGLIEQNGERGRERDEKKRIRVVRYRIV